MNSATLAGIGMTSQRTRTRMVERLRAQGISDSRVLHAMGLVPRHVFIEPALANRAYDDTALPWVSARRSRSLSWWRA
jgi:protein-L-isoaspartate(D-aspartate) O-methyltransferase